MCGIAGFYSQSLSKDKANKTIIEMLDSISYRGPDHQGIWQNNFLTFGHKRLSIQDLSPDGHQPMKSLDGRYTIIFNGEIYNFNELRSEFINVKLKGHSDTEVLLEAFSFWGLEKTLSKINGMFSFALWDNKLSTLFLARDRFGEKPLYYYYENGIFAFASEIKALENYGELNLEIDRSALTYQLENSFIPAPLSIYKKVRKIPPGNILTFSPNKNLKITPYWTIESDIIEGKNNVLSCEEEATEALKNCLSEAVRLRMLSDVPIGAFLSSGIDSNLIVSLMQENSSKSINTFSIGFENSEYNEAIYAKETAEYLGTNHHEEYLTSRDVLEIVPKLGEMFDEPFSDSSQIPSYLVSAVAKKNVTVCLSGDGGDELFFGYERYSSLPKIWSKIRRIPFKPTLANFLDETSPENLERIFFFLKPSLKNIGREITLGTKLKNMGNWISYENFIDFYSMAMRHWKNGNKIIKGGGYSEIWPKQHSIDLSIYEEMMYKDQVSYLPFDILTKVDRSSMFTSLETRIPFLDPQVSKISWRIPLEMKNKNGNQKWILKKILNQYLPKKFINKPKKGFALPISQWLRTDLKEWASDLLSKSRLDRQNLYHHKPITEKLEKHLKGTEDNGAFLWDVLMAQAWIEGNPDRHQRI